MQIVQNGFSLGQEPGHSALFASSRKRPNYSDAKHGREQKIRMKNK